MTYQYIEVTEEVHEALEHMAVGRGCSINNALWFSLYQLLRNPSQLDEIERRALEREGDDEWALFENDDESEV